eukprot:9500629-Pyramimonas_sp.AAC.1
MFRSELAGAPILGRAACVQMRGDWSWMKQAFNLTGWRGEGARGDVCWICSANKTDRDYRRADSGAPWRTERYSHQSFVDRYRAEA